MNLEVARVRVLLLVVLTLAALAALFAVTDRHDYEPLHSFHVVAEVLETDTSGSPSEATISRVEGWYRDGKLRWELSYSGPNAPIEPSIEMTDGKTTYYYDATQGTYFEEPLLGKAAGAYLAIDALPQFSIEDFLRSRSKSQSLASSNVRDGALLGREVEVIHTDELLSGAGPQQIHLAEQLTIDPAAMFILAYEVDSPAVTQRWTTTEVEYNAQVSDDEFVFTPPASAKRIDPPVWSPANLQRMASGDVGPPPGFYKPERLPEGYRLVGRNSFSAAAGGTPNFSLAYISGSSAPGAAYLNIVQEARSTSVPDDARSDDVVQINAAQGYFTKVGVATELSWRRGDVLITLQADQLSRAQLLSVARSMR